MPATTHFEGLVLKYALIGQTNPFAVQWWMTFHTAVTPTAANEWSLARQQVLWTTSFANSNQVVFPFVVTGVTLLSVSFWDVVTGGSMLVWDTITSLPLVGGQQLIAAPGQIQMDVPNT